MILEEQGRGRWDRGQIGEALPLVEEALRDGPGPFAVQAAISAVHCRAARAVDTDWPQIVRLYDILERLQPSPVVALNRAVAVAMASGPEAALAILDRLAAGSAWTAIICCMLRAPICCGGWVPGRKRPKATGARWN